MNTDILIISGFLGAGKTTFIKELITSKFRGKKIAVIENEFGDIGFDGDYLRETTPIVTEIRSGCICCSLTGEFKNSIRYIIENYYPEIILIEPSGVARTSELINSCLELSEMANLKHVINVIDCKNHSLYERNFEGFYRNQILSSDIIYLSKTELVNKEDLDTIKDGLTKLNPGIELISDESFLKMEEVYSDLHIGLDLMSEEQGLHEGFQHYCFITDVEFDEASINKKLDSLRNAFSEIYRVKGILDSDSDYSYRVDMVESVIDIKRAAYGGIGRICFIGFNLNKIRIRDLFSIGKI